MGKYEGHRGGLQFIWLYWQGNYKNLCKDCQCFTQNLNQYFPRQFNHYTTRYKLAFLLKCTFEVKYQCGNPLNISCL
jgi:hypothetical protein